ncbi:hypothetical protein JTB14_002190 [Gonioctena quinquepunctata]|nr:hypothetical protein JTB14_002190 [Gonioctena quinquepunctata]
MLLLKLYNNILFVDSEQVESAKMLKFISHAKKKEAVDEQIGTIAEKKLKHPGGRKAVGEVKKLDGYDHFRTVETLRTPRFCHREGYKKRIRGRCFKSNVYLSFIK